MMFTDYQQAVVDAIHQALPSLKSVQAHGGSITEAEIKRWGAQAPAVFVSILAVRPAQTTFIDQADLVFSAYVVTRNMDKDGRSGLALNIVQGLNRLLKSAPWSEGFVSKPQGAESQNLFNTDIDKMGISLWATTWQQTVELGASTNLDDLADFITFAADYELGDEQGPVAQDRVTLPTA